jgi:crotonobetainyl-CoA:carnitine CoA-transferase CaiB-like acyl-CoA transferase
MMGIVRAADGWIGINCLTGQHWLDVCAMLGLPEYGEHQVAIMLGGPERGEFFAKAEPWLSERSVAEILELSQAFRIPAAPVNDGETALVCPQSLERAFFVDGGGDDWTLRRPGAPSACRGRPHCRRAPRLALVRNRPSKPVRDRLIGRPPARAQIHRCHSQASRFLT